MGARSASKMAPIPLAIPCQMKASMSCQFIVRWPDFITERRSALRFEVTPLITFSVQGDAVRVSKMRPGGWPLE